MKGPGTLSSRIRLQVCGPINSHKATKLQAAASNNTRRRAPWQTTVRKRINRGLANDCHKLSNEGNEQRKNWLCTCAHIILVGTSNAGLSSVPRFADWRIVVVGCDTRPVHAVVYAPPCHISHMHSFSAVAGFSMQRGTAPFQLGGAAGTPYTRRILLGLISSFQDHAPHAITALSCLTEALPARTLTASRRQASQLQAVPSKLAGRSGAPWTARTESIMVTVGEARHIRGHWEEEGSHQR